jgi:hypothetical protein
VRILSIKMQPLPLARGGTERVNGKGRGRVDDAGSLREGISLPLGKMGNWRVSGVAPALGPALERKKASGGRD